MESSDLIKPEVELYELFQFLIDSQVWKNGEKFIPTYMMQISVRREREREEE